MLENVIESYGGVEVPPMAVYGDIFNLGSGFLQKSGELGGKEGGEFKANPLILGSFNGKIRRRILLEDTFEETLAEMQQADWAITNGITYWGRRNTAAAQSRMCAMIFDLDGQDDGTLTNLLFNCRSDYPIYPEPNYIVLSGHNVHLYYVLDEPVDLYPNTKTLVKDMKYRLTDRLWNKYTSNIEKPQHQGINQGFRVIGCRAKDGGVVRAFRVNAHPFTLEELNEFLPVDQQVDLSRKWKESRYTKEECRELFPDWYEAVIEGKGRVTGRWKVKEDLYEWWKRKIREGASYGHRYFCLMALAVFATKCGITDRERVKADMEELVPFLDSIDSAHPFGNDGEVKAALECFDMRYATFPRADLAQLTSIDMPPNKRNGRTQEQHLAYLNGMRKMRRDILGEDEYGNGGRPKGSPNKKHPKRDAILAYAAEHPGESQRAIAKALGVSPATVNKWLKSSR